MNEHQDQDFQTVVLAALLHDIGKFAQRSGQHTGRSHPELSAWFAREQLANWPHVEDVVSNHHLSGAATAQNPRLALTVALADWLSSGERRDLPEGETGQPGDDALISVFSKLGGSTDYTRFPLIELAADGKLEPGPDVRASRNNYERLWDRFTREFAQLRTDEFGLLVDRLLALLEKHTSFVPSAAWRSESDISLYHHLKSTAAIAACLHKDGLDAAAINVLLDIFRAGQPGGQAVACLVGGDLSGIQSFIYNLRAKGALKGLRGRSLYLQLLPEAVAALVLDEFGLTRANLLYCGGGHFYALVPAVDSARQTVEEIGRKVNQVLLSAHAGRLSISLAVEELCVSDFRREEFGRAWERLHDRLAREKRRRFSSLFDRGSREQILGPIGVGGEPSACSVCGEETKEKDDEGEPRCPMCASFAAVGRELHDAQFISERPCEPRQGRPVTWTDAVASFGRKYCLIPRPEGVGRDYVLNQTDFAAAGLRGFRFLARHVPMKGHEVADLEDIAAGSDGIHRWGVLRMDVDSLGETFKTGLGDNRSISRLSMLSYLLGYFFSARVQAVAQDAAFKDKVYLAYSGGDDLFAIGAWSALPNFAERIREEFRRFTSNRLTLSAGVFVAPSEKFPVYEAADQAGDAEHSAKSETKNKDRISFLGSVVTWSELAQARAVKDKLVGLVNDGLPRSLLAILRSSWGQRTEAKDGTIPIFPIWRLYYALKRLKERHKELAQRVDDLEKLLVKDNDLHPQLDLIVRWAEFELRR